MLPKYFKNFGILSCKLVLNVVLFVLYVYFFGVPSFQRYMEKSIVTITKDLDISSSEIEIKPGKIIMIDILINLNVIFDRYMADTQYFKTETWTETSTGPNKCLNQDQDCVCFNGQDRDCPRPSLVSSPVACTGTRTAPRPGVRPQY